MCSKGGGSPPVPSAASTTFNSTTQPSAFATPLYQDFLNRANAMSNTPFNPAQLGQVAPLNAQQLTAGNQLYNLGLDAGNFGATLGNFDPAQVRAIESPYTEDVVNATQNWFNNQNAIQGNDLISQAIRSGNAFGGDRAGIGEAVLAGQQQLAQAPVIAGLRQAGYTQALNEYNQLKQFGLAGRQFGLQGAGAALGWGGLQQAQQQREFDVAQQNAMMQSAYPFQTMNWYGSILGGIAPLLGQTAFGSNNPPEASGLGSALGVGSAAVGLGTSALNAFGGPTQQQGGGGGWRGGNVRHFDDGGPVSSSSIYDDQDYSPKSDDEDRPSDTKRESYMPSERDLPSTTATAPHTPNLGLGQMQRSAAAQAPQLLDPRVGAGRQQQQQKSDLQSGLELGKSVIDLGIKAAPYLAMLSDPKTKTDIQRVGRTDDGEPLYGFRYRGDPKSYPKVVGPMAHPRAWGGYIPHLADGGFDDPLTMTDLGVLSEEGNELPANIAGPARGSPAGFNPVQASDVSNLERVRERFKPRLEADPALARKFDINTTAEVGTRPLARDFYQALTMDRAASRGEDLAYTLSPKAGYYPPETLNATRASGMGVSPILWGGANPANFATGNASYDPRTGRWVGFARGPQTGSVQTGSGTETGGIEGPDLAAARRFGYQGPSRTAIGRAGPQGTGAMTSKEVDEAERPSTGPATRGAGTSSSGERTGSTQPALRDQSKTIPELAKPPKTFAQNLAGNPFWQFGTALMAKPGIKGREGQAIGSALMGMNQLQTQQRAADLLEAKPQMITMPNGNYGWILSNGKVLDSGMLDPSQGRASAADKRAEETHRRQMAMPTEITTEKPGPFGTTKTTKSPVVYDPKTDQLMPWTPPAQSPPATSAPPAAAPATPAAPQAPPSQSAPSVQQPQQPAPAVRQSQAEAEPNDWQEIGKDTGTYYSASTQQYKMADGRIIPALDKGVRPGLPPSQAQAGAGPVFGGPEAPSAAGPAEGPSLQNTNRAWQTGEVQPAGTITDPVALERTRNAAAIAHLTPDEQKTIKNIVDGKADPYKLYVGKQADLREPVMRLAQAYDPNYSPALAAQRQKAAVAFGVNGVEARNIQAHDTAIQHMGRAMTNLERLNNYDYEWVNKVRDWKQKNIPGTRDPKLQQAIGALDFDYHAVASELMRAFRGTGQASEREAERIGHKLNVYNPLDVQRSAIKEATELLYGRVEASAKTYNGAVGEGFQRSPESWLSNKGRETLDRALNIDPNVPIPTAPGARPQQPQQPGPSAPVRIQSMEEADKLPPNTQFIIPDGSGRIGTVPGRAQ